MGGGAVIHFYTRPEPCTFLALSNGSPWLLARPLVELDPA